MATGTVQEAKVTILLNNGTKSGVVQTVPLHLENISNHINSHYDNLLSIVDTLETCLTKEVYCVVVTKEEYITHN